MNSPTGGGEILLVTSSYPRWQGDATTPFVHHLAQDLRSLGWDVRVLAPHAPGAARDEILDGVPVHRFRYLWPESSETACYDGGALVKLRANRWKLLKVAFLVVAQWIAISRRLARRNVALVHSHWLLPQGFTATLATKRFAVPHLATVHGGDVFALRGRLMRAFKRMALRSADAVTVNSSATQEAVESLQSDVRALTRIPMGATEVPAPSAATIPGMSDRTRLVGGPLVVFVGRLVREKGVSDLIEAVDIARASLPDIRAVIVGDGPDREQLRGEAIRRNLADRVSFAGWVSSDQVHRHLAAANMLIAPSRPAPDGWVEAQGLTIAEAMLAGVPVIATDCGGIRDSVRHESTGLIVPAGAPAEIAAAIGRLASDGALADRLVRNARELARAEFTREVCAQRFSALYARILGSPARPNT